MALSVNENIAVLCGEYADGNKPLSRSEFWKLFHACDDNIENMAKSGNDRVAELLKRSASIGFSMQKIEQMGIRLVSFLDEEFPHRLKEKLGDLCPPLLYACGNNSILSGKFTGYVGSRSVGSVDKEWTERCVVKNINEGFGVVTGGARGVDSISANCALDNGAKVIMFLPDNLREKIEDSSIRQKLWDDELLLYSHVSPLAKKTKYSFVNSAMERNKFIYAESNATVVVRSDEGKGGTWSGAKEALTHKWVHVFVWNNPEYKGNQALIKMGGIPLSDDLSPEKNIDATGISSDEKSDDKGKQMTLEDMFSNNE